jgi:hypothetical protein
VVEGGCLLVEVRSFERLTVEEMSQFSGAWVAEGKAARTAPPAWQLIVFGEALRRM